MSRNSHYVAFLKAETGEDPQVPDRKEIFRGKLVCGREFSGSRKESELCSNSIYAMIKASGGRLTAIM